MINYSISIGGRFWKKCSRGHSSYSEISNGHSNRTLRRLTKRKSFRSGARPITKAWSYHWSGCHTWPIPTRCTRGDHLYNKIILHTFWGPGPLLIPTKVGRFWRTHWAGCGTDCRRKRCRTSPEISRCV